MEKKLGASLVLGDPLLIVFAAARQLAGNSFLKGNCDIVDWPTVEEFNYKL